MKSSIGMLVLIGFGLVSCSKYESPSDEMTTTTVMGTLKDLERGSVHTDIPVYVWRTYSCGDFLGLCREFIDSTVTDRQGNYTMTFPVRTMGSGYSVTHKAINTCEELYTSDEIDPQPLVPGETNIRNFDVWCPLVLKLTLQIRNNDSPPLLVHAYPDNPEIRNFPDVELIQREIDTVVYLYTKPKIKTNLTFQYRIEDPNANFHVTSEWFDVGIQDTLALSRVVSCADF